MYSERRQQQRRRRRRRRRRIGSTLLDRCPAGNRVSISNRWILKLNRPNLYIVRAIVPREITTLHQTKIYREFVQRV